MSAELSTDQIALLRWLGKEDFSQYGECCGRALDRLIELGLAQHHERTGRDNTFIAKGDAVHFDAVSVTDAGREFLRRTPASDGRGK